MPLFTPDVVATDDKVGFGHWLNAHYYEHQQFIQIGLQQTPRIEFVNYDLLAWDFEYRESMRSWLEVHEQMHESMRGPAGVSGIDLSSVDPGNEASFQNWLNFHALEHAQLRQAFGVT